MGAWDVNITDLIQEYNNDTISEMSIHISGLNLSEVYDIGYSLDGGNTLIWKSVKALDYTFTEPTSIEGNNSWVAYVNDTTGVIKNDSINFWVDSIAPVLSYVTPVSQVTYTNQDSLNFQFLLNETNKGSYDEDNFAPFFLQFSIPNSAIVKQFILKNLSSEQQTFSESLNYALSVAEKKQGNYSYFINVKDVYSNSIMIREVNVSGTIVRDTISPSITLTSPANNSNNTGIFNITATASDLTSGVKNITLLITNNSGYDYSDNCSDVDSCTFSWNSALAPDGQVIITATSTDKAGNSNQTQISIEIDNTNPQIYFNSPNANSYNESQILNISAIDAHLMNISLYVNGTLVNFTTASELFYTLGEGQYSVYAKAYDTFGNQNQTETRTIIVDLTAPIINLNGNDTQYIELGSEVYSELGATATDNKFDGNINGKIIIDNSSVNSSTLGYYNVSYFVNDSVNNIYLVNRTVIVRDTASPIINIYAPSPESNKAYINGIEFVVNYTSTDFSDISTCYLLLDGSINAAGFNLTSLTIGNHNYSIFCNDTLNNQRTTTAIWFTILADNSEAFEFTASTNLTASNDISNVVGFFVENTFGNINFTGGIDFSSGLDWSKFINISENRVEVNSTGAPELNKTATITLFNITWTTPRILVNGAVCSSSVCNIVSYNATSGTLIFTVTGFSTYTTEETPVVASSSSSSGGGSSSNTCTTSWTCTLWTSCNSGTQTRTCSKVNSNCDAQEDKPAESQTCASSNPLLEETSETSENNEVNSGNPTTGAVIGGNGKNILIGVGFIIFIVIVYLLIKMKKKLPHQEHIKMIKSSV